MRQVLIISLAQFLGCSLWFSVNGVSASLIESWSLLNSDIGLLTGSVQAGFIFGTLWLAVSNLADRFRPSLIFLAASLLGGIMNLCFAYLANGLIEGMFYRFIVGVCLAGVYPIGMKLIVTWSPETSGFGLGLMVAMLTLGTASPHLLSTISWVGDWKATLALLSLLALLGGLIVWHVGEGPFGIKQSGSIRWGHVFKSFKIPRFRASACGYFGHMWELYAFWTVAPTLIILSIPDMPANELSLWTFAVIGIGAIGAFCGGLLSRVIGSGRVAFISLLISGLMCLLFPILANEPALALGALLIWGFFVISDSAQFSSISSKSCQPEVVGSALSIQNSLGFSISIVSILLLTKSIEIYGINGLWLLVPGPVLGLIAMKSLLYEPTKPLKMDAESIKAC